MAVWPSALNRAVAFPGRCTSGIACTIQGATHSTFNLICIQKSSGRLPCERNHTMKLSSDEISMWKRVCIDDFDIILRVSCWVVGSKFVTI